MKIATILGLLAAFIGFLLTQGPDQPSSSLEEATNTPSRSVRYQNVFLRDIPSEDFEILRSTGEYSFRHPGDGSAAIKDVFVYAEPFEKGFARVEVRNEELQRSEFRVINRDGNFVNPDEVPEGLGWDMISKKEDPETGVDYFVGPEGSPLSSSKEVPGVTDPKGTSHSIVEQGDLIFFGGKTYHEGSFSSRKEVFLSNTPLKEIAAAPLRADETIPRFFVVTLQGEKLWLLDTEVTAFLRDPDFIPSLAPPIDYFGEGGLLERLSKEGK